VRLFWFRFSLSKSRQTHVTSLGDAPDALPASFDCLGGIQTHVTSLGDALDALPVLDRARLEA
jgi:hypothetical protein